jgi:general stress protein CsbA
MVGLKPSVPQLNSDSPVPIAAFILTADLPNLISLTTVFLWVRIVLQVIVITASGDFGYYQKHL